MKAKQLIIMLTALAVLATITLIQRKGEKKYTPKTDNNTTLFQGLELNTLDGVEIFQGSETNTAKSKVVMAKEGDVWKVESLYDYPADFSKLANALRAASDVKLGNPIRSANVDASEYGFNKAKTLVLKSSGKDAVKLEIGAQREASKEAGWANQHFVRKAGTDSIYLVNYDFRPFSEDSTDWINKTLLNISSSDIVSVQTADAKLKEDAGKWTLVSLNEKTEELQTSEANKLRSALQYLNCTAIADPKKSDTDLGFDNPTTYTASTTNKTITVTLGNKTDAGRFIRFKGDVPEKLNGWTYEISSYKADSFLIPRDKLVKKKTEEKKKPAAENSKTEKTD